MSLIDELIATAQPRTEQVRICARGDLVASHAEEAAALDRLMRARTDESLEGDPALEEAAARVVAVEEALEAATVTFTVRSVSRQRWADLVRAHPPSTQERRAGHDTDPATFPVAVIAACTQTPAMSEDQARKLAEVLPSGEFQKLWMAALNLNLNPTPAPKLGAATDLLRANGRSSTTSAPEASLEDGSSAGSGEQ